MKKICFKIPIIFNLENVIMIFIENLVNVAMRMEEAFYNISMYLYNKNLIEYARSEPKSMICNIEGSSTVDFLLKHENQDRKSFVWPKLDINVG